MKIFVRIFISILLLFKPFIIFDVLLILVSLFSLYFRTKKHYTPLSPGLILTRKDEIEMVLTPKTIWSFWKAKTKRKAFLISRLFINGLDKLCELTNETKTYRITTNISIYKNLDKYVKHKQLPVTVTQLSNHTDRQVLERLSLVPFWMVWKIGFQSLFGNQKAIETLRSWFKKLEMVELELTIHK